MSAEGNDYCSEYCKHNADGNECQCAPCHFIRTKMPEFEHMPGCPHAPAEKS